jgi:acetyl esterase/lipase
MESRMTAKRWQARTGAVVGTGLLIALAACADAPRATEPESAVPSTVHVPVADPSLSMPPSVEDPTGTMIGWLDQRYAKADDTPAELESLDLITSKAALADGRGVPILVAGLGGTWKGGDKRTFLTQKSPLASAGFLLASINYRLSPRWLHPAHVEDTAGAIAWLHRHGARFGGDPERIVLMGHSAGVHLAALIATDERWLGAHGLPLTILDGVVSLDGASFDLAVRGGATAETEAVLEGVFGPDRDVWADASPARHVAAGKGIPPFLLFYTEGREVGVEESARFEAILRGASIPVERLLAAGKSHRNIHRDLGKPGDPVTEKVLEFILAVTGTA